MALSPGTRLGHYDVTALLGEGGMGQVRRVYDTRLSGDAALKSAGSFSDWHVGPTRRYIINLTGGGQLEVGEGKVDLPPGSVEYIDDLL